MDDNTKPEDKAEIPAKPEAEEKPEEIGGAAGPEPTRFGDWEKAGRCSDF